MRSEWDLQLCYLSAKDVGGRLAWIQWGRGGPQSTSCHCSLFKNVPIKGMKKVWLPTWFASVIAIQWRDHGWLFFPEFAIRLISMHTSKLWKVCLYIVLLGECIYDNNIFKLILQYKTPPYPSAPINLRTGKLILIKFTFCPFITLESRFTTYDLL